MPISRVRGERLRTRTFRDKPPGLLAEVHGTEQIVRVWLTTTAGADVRLQVDTGDPIPLPQLPQQDGTYELDGLWAQKLWLHSRHDITVSGWYWVLS